MAIRRLKDPPTWLKVATNLEKLPTPTHTVCLVQWPLTLTYIFKVIQPWVCNKTAKIWHILLCPLYSTHFWMNSFHILHKWSLSPNLFSCDTHIYHYIPVWHKYNPWWDDVSCTISRSKVISHGSLEFLWSVRGYPSRSVIDNL